MMVTTAAYIEAALYLAMDASRGKSAKYRDDVLGWLHDCVLVRTQEAVISFIVLPWHREFLTSISDRDIVLKSRDTGMSTLCVAIRMHDAIFNPPCDILVAADREENAKNLVDYARTLLGGLPSGQLSYITKDNETELEFWCWDAGGNLRTSSIKAITATPKTGRSFRCRHLICTEMGFWDKARRYWTSVTGSVTANGTIICESTWPEDGAATEYGGIWSDPARGFTRHFVGRLDVPWHDTRWEAKRRLDLTNADFSREYPAAPEDAIAAPSENTFRVFSRDALRRFHDFDDDTILNLDIDMSLGPPVPNRRYLTAWDLGQSRNGRGATVGLTLDVTEQVHFVRMLQRYEGLPWPLVQKAIAETDSAFPGETWVEVNGPGDPVIANVPANIHPFWTSVTTKTYAIKKAVLQMEQGYLKCNNRDDQYPEVSQLDIECTLYEWKDTNLVQDCVMALVIGEYSADVGGRGFVM